MVVSAKLPLPASLPSADADAMPSISTEAAAATVAKRRSMLRLLERAGAFTECLVFICGLPREIGAGRLDAVAASRFKLTVLSRARSHSEKCHWQKRISKNSFEALMGAG